jgi:PAS domain
MDTDSATDTARDETFRLLFDAAPFPAWIVDAKTLTLRFREVNAAAVAACGCARGVPRPACPRHLAVGSPPTSSP